jgi:hypothetical protein
VVTLISPTWVTGIIGMSHYTCLTTDFLLLLNNILLCRYPQFIGLATERHAFIASSFWQFYINLLLIFLWILLSLPTKTCVWTWAFDSCGKIAVWLLNSAVKPCLSLYECSRLSSKVVIFHWH